MIYKCAWEIKGKSRKGGREEGKIDSCRRKHLTGKNRMVTDFQFSK